MQSELADYNGSSFLGQVLNVLKVCTHPIQRQMFITTYCMYDNNMDISSYILCYYHMFVQC